MEEMKKRRVLITGGNGFLGRALASQCLERGDRVFSLARHDHAGLELMGVHQIKGDISDQRLLLEVCKDKDLVFHLAARSGCWGKMADFYKTNVKGTRNVIEACRRGKVPVLVYTSTTRVLQDNSGAFLPDSSKTYPDRFLSNYAMSKAFAEQAVLKASTPELRCAVLRPHMIWGPGDASTLPGLVKGDRKLVRVGKGDVRVSGIYIENAVQAHLQLAERLEEDDVLAGKVLTLVQNEPIDIWEMVRNMEKWTGRKRVVAQLPYPVAMAWGRALEGAGKLSLVNKEPFVTQCIVKELKSSHVFDTTPIECELGFTPQVSVSKGMEMYKKWLKTKGVNQNRNR